MLKPGKYHAIINITESGIYSGAQKFSRILRLVPISSLFLSLSSLLSLITSSRSISAPIFSLPVCVHPHPLRSPPPPVCIYDPSTRDLFSLYFFFLLIFLQRRVTTCVDKGCARCGCTRVWIREVRPHARRGSRSLCVRVLGRVICDVSGPIGCHLSS